MLNRILLVCSLLLCFSQSSHAALNHDSSLNWLTVESENFRIHYHDNEELLAAKSLQIAESVYRQLTPELDWKPKKKTEIVLSDETDMSNGFAMPLPSNRMTLFVSRPTSVSSLEDHNGWLETLILHEFVHILHLDKALGSPKNMRRIFGRFALLFPNMFMPPWMHEGLATYYETDRESGIGRGQSSYFEMMMRIEVEDGVKPLRQINQPIVTWPLLTSRYLYGVYFYQFLADTYGPEVIPRVVQSYSHHLIPFRINDLYEDVLGKDLSQLWSEYQSYLENKFRPQLDELKQHGLFEGERISRTGDFKRSLQATEQGRLFFVSDHLQKGSQLMVREKNGETAPLADLSFGARLDWHKSSGLLIAQPEVCNNANRYYDLYQMDAVTGEQRRLTTCQRYIFATWSVDGKNIVAVRNYRGQHALHLLSSEGVVKEVLWQGKDEQTLSGIDWSQDGKSLVTTMWRKDSGWNIEEFDIAAKRWISRTSNVQVKTDASYIKDSRDIIFSMESEGVYNAFRLYGGSGEIRQLSHVSGGLFSPFITQDNQLLSINYNASGFDVYKIPEPQSDVVQVMFRAKYEPLPAAEAVAVEMSEARPYEPWDSLKPTSWFPSVVFLNQGMELGAYVSGTDVLNRHSFDLFAGYQQVSQSPVIALNYVYDRWDPLLKVHVQQLETPKLNNQDALIALTKDKRLDAELIFPWITERQRWSAHLGLNHQRSEISWLAPGYTSRWTGYRDTLSGMALIYDAREAHARSVSNVSAGRLWSVLLESGEYLGGDYTGTSATIAGREYVDLADEHVLALRMDLAKGTTKVRPFYLGGTQLSNILPNVTNALTASAAFNKRVYALRGYGEGEKQLSGQNMALVSAEYRFPISRVERGWMAPPVGVDQVFGQLFVDAGRAWNTFELSKTYVGLGAELGADMVFFYMLPIRMQLGYATGLDATIGGEQVYFRIGSSF